MDAEDIINQNEIKPISIRTNNLNGVAEATKGSFVVYRLKQPEKVFRNRLWAQADRNSLTKEEYYKTFPNDLYADELNKYKWEKETKLLEKAFDTGSKTEYDLAAELKSQKAGQYFIEAICKDKFGEEIKAFQYFTLFKMGGNESPEVSPQWFYTDKHKAEPGEKISFILNSGYSTNYLYELEHKGKIVDSKMINAPSTKQLLYHTFGCRFNIRMHAPVAADQKLLQATRLTIS